MVAHIVADFEYAGVMWFVVTWEGPDGLFEEPVCYKMQTKEGGELISWHWLRDAVDDR